MFINKIYYCDLCGQKITDNKRAFLNHLVYENANKERVTFELSITHKSLSCSDVTSESERLGNDVSFPIISSMRLDIYLAHCHGESPIPFNSLLCEKEVDVKDFIKRIFEPDYEEARRQLKNLVVRSVRQDTAYFQ